MNGLFVKLLSSNLSALQIGFFRFFLGAVFMFFLIKFLEKEKIRFPQGGDLWEYAFLGFLLAVTAFLVSYAFSVTSIHIVSLILALAPLFITGISFFLIKEKIPKNFIYSFFCGFAGLMILNPFDFSSEIQILGVLAAFANLFVAGLFVAMERKEDKAKSLQYLFWVFAFAAIFLLFLNAPGLGTLSSFDFNILEVLLIGLFPGALAYYFLNKAMEDLSASIVGISEMTVIPISSVIFAMLFAGEVLTFSTIIATIFLLGSAALLFEDELKNLFKSLNKNKVLVRK